VGGWVGGGAGMSSDNPETAGGGLTPMKHLVILSVGPLLPFEDFMSVLMSPG
jgi:hypothetical protein